MTLLRGNVFALLLVFFAAVASPAVAEQFHDSTAHFTLTIPKGWQRMPPANILAMNAEIKAGDKWKVTAGFSANEESDHPGAQIVIEQNPVPSGGFSDDQLIKEIRESFPTFTFIENDDASQWQDLRPGEARYDRKHHRLFSRAEPEQIDDSALHEFAIMQMGKTHTVRVHFVAVDEEYSNALKDFKLTASTFRIDNGFEFVASSGHREFDFGRVLVRAIFGLLAPIILPILAYFKMKKPKNRLPDKLDWSDAGV